MRIRLQGVDWDQASSCTAFRFRWGTRLHDGSAALRQKCELPAKSKQKTSEMSTRCSLDVLIKNLTYWLQLTLLLIVPFSFFFFVFFFFFFFTTAPQFGLGFTHDRRLFSSVQNSCSPSFTPLFLKCRFWWPHGLCVGLLLLACWYCVFESRRERVCFSLVNIASCAVRGLCDGPIPHPGSPTECEHARVCH